MTDKPNFTNHTGDDYEWSRVESKTPEETTEEIIIPEACNLCGSQRCYPEYCSKLHPELKQMCDLMCPESEPEYDEQDKGFEIKCLNCGSTNCVISQELEYDYNENSSIGRPFIVCQDCYQSNA